MARSVSNLKTMKNNYIVYVHTNKKDGKRYVGITRQSPNRRWRNGQGYYQNQHFYRAICRDGWDNFTHEIIKAGLTKAEACKLEKEKISEFKSNNERYGYNKSSGGENPNEGTKMSDLTKAKMSRAHKDIVFTEERKKKMSVAAKARGNGLIGKLGMKSQRAGIVKQIDINTNETIAEYGGFYEMQRETGFAQSPVKRATRGEQKQSYGYKWEYIPKKEILCHY